ncbi:hypothetical protein [Desulfosoma caldarium]|uniref:Uncharacterized protein n=1 Tax=Desulfosoma caldarium TaxID=610254 RepID=A0A3N1VPK8_9BACT|nr:hypothetical protein [Desulfosoma caldarium]ROR02961.1 hypothetical protein EDC27_0215 [Desulfosoma caldarium]
MSFYCYLTTAQAIVVAADNKKQVLSISTDPMGMIRSEKVTAWNAQKIHAVGFGWWMTGIGLSAFLDEVRKRVRHLMDDEAQGAMAAAKVMERLVAESGWLQSLYEHTIAGLMEDLAPGLTKPEWLEQLQEIVFAGFDEAERPVVMRAQSVQEFAFEKRTGAGYFGFAGENAGWDPEVREDIGRYLSDVLDDLRRRPAAEMAHRVWDLLPPLFQRMARAFPEKISASGDLVYMTPTEHRWLLF